MWETIVLNLLSNALKFTFDGSIEVVLRPDVGSAVLTVGADASVAEALRWLPETPMESQAGTAARPVLLADDNPDMRRYIHRLLRKPTLSRSHPMARPPSRWRASASLT